MTYLIIEARTRHDGLPDDGHICRFRADQWELHDHVEALLKETYADVRTRREVD